MTLIAANVNQYVQENVLNKAQEVEESTTAAMINDALKESYYGISTKGALTLQSHVGGKIQRNGKWHNATQTEINKYMVPTRENIGQYKYQFLNLEAMAGISQQDAKAYLSDKGILKDKEATFLKAAQLYNINEIYLMAHACLETGNGTSQLAKGVPYKGKIVYNMFGIKAYDNNPVGKGAEYAYIMDWTTPEKAILGGARFISDQYINNDIYKQDTLYEMRWNPASPGTHQYATDVAWATKQSQKMEQIYKCFENPNLSFDIPVYRK